MSATTAAREPPLVDSGELPESASPGSEPRRAHFALKVGLAVALALLVVLIAPFLAPLVLAAWLAAASRPWLRVLERRLHGRKRAAALLTLATIVLVMGPVVAIVSSLSVEAIELGQGLASSASGREALAQLVSSDDAGSRTYDPAAIFTMLEAHGTRALELASVLSRFGAELALGVFVFFGATYVLMVDGPTAWAWTVRHAPLDPAGLERLRGAFHETGRGLFIGVGVTGLVQATIATIGFLVLGVPRALVLGVMTLFASVLPPIGTALVWLPVSLALAITGRTTAAIILAVVGLAVVSTVDNVLRPLLTRWGHLALHPFVVLVSMLSGLALLGATGLFLGPLTARLCIEIVRMGRDGGLLGPRTDPGQS